MWSENEMVNVNGNIVNIDIEKGTLAKQFYMFRFVVVEIFNHFISFILQIFPQ